MKILTALISAIALVACSQYGDRSASAGGASAAASEAGMGSMVGPDSKRARSTEPAVRTQ